MNPAPERLLVVVPSWVGDATMATPAFTALRGAWPTSHITALCRPGIDRVLDALSAFDDRIVGRIGGLLGPVRAGIGLRRRRFDVAILFPNSFRTALAVRTAGVPTRVGYARDGRGSLLTDAIDPPPKGMAMSTVDYYCDLVERGFGITITDRSPRLAVSADDARGADRALEGVTSPFAILVPGANRADKRWPPDRFAAVARHLVRIHGMNVAVVGSPNEKPVLESVLQLAETDVIDLSSRGLDLGGLKAVLSRAALVITNDTGPRHIAAAFRVPTVALFGPTDHRWTTLRGASERILVAEPFLPEELVADDRERFCAVDRISVGDVIAAADAALADATRFASRDLAH